MVEHLVLHRHDEREGTRLRTGGIIGDAVRHADLELNRRVAAEQRAVVERHAVVEHARADARHGPVVQRVAQAAARLEHVRVRLREPVGEAMEQPIDAGDARRRNDAVRGAREPGSGQHDAVVDVAADDEPARRIDRHPARRIVEGRIEHRRVVQQGVPRRPQHVADAAFDRQLVGRLPAVLHEGVHRERAPFRERPCADLAVVGEEPHRGVRHRDTGTAGAAVGELEAAVLVVRVAGLRVDVDLIEVVLSGVFDEDTCLEGMTTLQVTDVVRPRIDRSAGRGWIRSAVHFREVRDRNRRNLVLDFLAGKNIRVVDPVAAALIQARFGEHVDVHLVERVTEGEFVEKVRPNRAGPAQRRRRVRSVPLRARQIEPRARTKCVDRLPREVRYATDDLIRGVCDVVDP